MFPPPIPPHRSSSTGEDLIPDPLFITLRSALTRGPIGWIVRRFDAWQDAREARREALAAVAKANHLLRTTGPVTTLTDREEPPADLAA